MLGYKAHYTPKTNVSAAKWGNQSINVSSAQGLTNVHSRGRLQESGTNRDYLGSRIESAKQTIREVIDELAEKKQMNDEALREVTMVNGEIVDFLRPINYLPNREPRRADRYSRADQALVSDFLTSPQPQEEHLSLTEENLHLRARLNAQIKRSNQLQSMVSNLSRQNQLLREERIHPSNNYQMAALRQQNERLRFQLGRSTIPQELFDDMQALKAENQQLRKETLALLKKERLV